MDSAPSVARRVPRSRGRVLVVLGLVLGASLAVARGWNREPCTGGRVAVQEQRSPKGAGRAPGSGAVAQVTGPAAVWDIPGGLAAAQIPQFILLTHDDGTSKNASKYVSDITDRHTNPNGCKINAVFYTTKFYSTCAAVQMMYNAGHEIGEHTMNHPRLSNISFAEKRKEIVGARDWIVNACKIPRADVVGHRSPFLADDAEVRQIVSEAGFLYDSSIQEIYNSTSSPSSVQRAWPYRLSSDIRSWASCVYFGSNNCLLGEQYPHLYEIPMWYPQKESNELYTPSCMDIAEPYPVYKHEFDNNAKGNKAPIGIYVHSTATGYLTQQQNRDGINRFLAYALAHKDVWVVTPRQLLDWQSAPVPASQMAGFMSNYKCNR